jgi:alpha-L-glutamate ligase-like protein
MLNIFRGLKNKGVLGINGRNANFTLKYNPRRFYPLVDDKLRTKRLAQANAIPVPELYALVEAAGQVRDLPDALKQYSDFVIKPAHGSGGEGILIVSREDNGAFRRQNGDPLPLEELKHHVLNSLSGLYSLGGQPDEVLAEYRVEFDPVFEMAIACRSRRIITRQRKLLAPSSSSSKNPKDGLQYFPVRVAGSSTFWCGYFLLGEKCI